ncbi:hypothetical protein HZS_4377, partial [Henneguya salminicola]
KRDIPEGYINIFINYQSCQLDLYPQKIYENFLKYLRHKELEMREFQQDTDSNFPSSNFKRKRNTFF